MSIEQAARQALGHRRLSTLMSAIPGKDLANPHEVMMWLRAAVSLEPAVLDDGAFMAAHAAVSKWVAGADLQRRISDVYWNPKLRAEIGEARLEAAWRD